MTRALVITAAFFSPALLAPAAGHSQTSTRQPVPHSQSSPEPQLFAPNAVSIGGLTTYRPAFSPDGRTVYFTADVRGGYAIGVSQLENGQPRHLGPGVNTQFNELYPAVTASGTLYFARSEGGERSDLWRASRARGRYPAAVRLPPPVNSEAREAGVFVAPDESYILFDSTRAGGIGNSDIYRSNRLSTGWSAPVNLPAPINSSGLETSAMVSPDGRTLYFTSGRRISRPGIGAGLTLSALIAGATAPGNGQQHIYSIPLSTSGRSGPRK